MSVTKAVALNAAGWLVMRVGTGLYRVGGALCGLAGTLDGAADDAGYRDVRRELAAVTRTWLPRADVRRQPGRCTPGHCDRCIPNEFGEHVDVRNAGQLPCVHVDPGAEQCGSCQIDRNTCAGLVQRGHSRCCADCTHGPLT